MLILTIPIQILINVVTITLIIIVIIIIIIVTTMITIRTAKSSYCDYNYDAYWYGPYFQAPSQLRGNLLCKRQGQDTGLVPGLPVAKHPAVSFAVSETPLKKSSRYHNVNEYNDNTKANNKNNVNVI